MRRLRLWIATNGALQLTLKEAAEIACLEPHYLSRAFRRRVGHTFLDWTREYRMIWAVRAIESGQYSIDEVSKLVGYRDRRSLERAVKAATETNGYPVVLPPNLELSPSARENPLLIR